MIYAILKVIMRMSVGIFYKNIQLKDLHKLPVDKPIILACNHPNAFMDAIVLSVLLKQKLNYLVRSDVFDTKFKRWFFNEIGFVPIYRIQEGADQLHKNDETFKKCYELLSKKKTVLIFSEGLCIWEKRLRKLKKGTARIAFQSEEAADFKMGLQVVPVGLNYSNAKNFRSDLYIQFGDPIKVNDYAESYKTNKVKAINEFTQNLEKRMAQNLVVFHSRENDQLVEDIRTVYKKQLIKEKVLDNKNLEHDFLVTQKIADAVEYFFTAEKEKTEIFKGEIRKYLNEISSFGLKDYLLSAESINGMSMTRFLFHLMGLLVTLPIHLFGVINNYLPYKIAFNLSNKLVRNVEFHSSINIGIGTFLYLIFYTLQVLLIAIIFKNTTGTLVYAIAVPLTGVFSLYYWLAIKKVRGRFRLFSLVKSDKRSVERLIHERHQIINELENSRSQYKLALAVKNN